MEEKSQFYYRAYSLIWESDTNQHFIKLQSDHSDSQIRKDASSEECVIKEDFQRIYKNIWHPERDVTKGFLRKNTLKGSQWNK